MIAKFFVGGLAPETTEDDMRQHFEQFGELVDVAVMRDPLGVPRCFGFVQFADANTHMCAPTDDHYICNKKVDVKAAVPKEAIDQGAPVRTNKIFVGGLSKASTADSVTAHFSQFGTVTEVLMKFDEVGQSRGFCFVEFDNEDSADLACGTVPMYIDDKEVECKLARPLGDRSLGKGKGKGKGFGFGFMGKGAYGSYAFAGKGMGMAMQGKGGPMRSDPFGKGARPSPYGAPSAYGTPAPAYSAASAYGAPTAAYGRGIGRGAAVAYGGRGAGGYGTSYASPATPAASYGGYGTQASSGGYSAPTAYSAAPAYGAAAPAYGSATTGGYGSYSGYAQAY